MSFLSSVLSSIESGKPASIPPPAPVTPRSPAAGSSSATNKTDSRKTTPVSRDGSQKPTIAPAGTKRKAEEQLQRPDRANGQIQSKNATMKTATSHTSAAIKPRPAGTGPGGAAKPGEKPSTPAAMAASRPVAPAATTSKPPPKGSFADLMMKAKAAQEKAPVKVGMFKHQAVPKEKLSKSERKKRAMEALAKEKETKAGKKPGVTAGLSAGAKSVRPGEETAPKRRGPDEIEYKGTARPTQTTTYKGTAGLPPRRASNDPRGRSASRHGKPTRRDEYLGTDEEDEGDYEDDYDDYYSDESSDMEAGLMDVEEEEAAALRAAKKEDEEDIRAEMAAKREKLERKMKLAHLAKSRR
ncbi:hypothetical protein AOR_1_1072054 [Paecilomyces variotii No. 5]|uniref:SPT2 chromatin protein-domain-containing protein n=1 Tax=Byssochlamys spectabilis (strain No. 5 / NBRC 109023) TaxID=1356009 RepID=V5F999_BYSSN|nr:hypothetical protein AOR_1_1072054 [Paecilomyces variotii No. 5]